MSMDDGKTAASPPSSPFAKRGAIGRVNAPNLHAFNPRKKRDALKEKGYWEINKNIHPLNRRNYLRWEKAVRQESVFLDRATKLPVDQKFRLKKSLMGSANVRFAIPVGIGCYFLFSWARHKVFGVTPADGSMGIARYIQFLPRAPS